MSIRHIAIALLDRFIGLFSLYGVPLAIAVMSLLALAAWQPQYPASGARQLDLQVLEQAGAALEPAAARDRLAGIAAEPYRDTRLSEAPFWFRFVAGASPRAGNTELELGSRHAVEVECWHGETLAPLGHATREWTRAGMAPVKAGFALRAGQLAAPLPVLCRARFAGPARITVLEWPEQALEASAHQFHRRSGLLDGGMIVLALFVLVTALINREWTYVLFAAWLIASLRLAAISSGLDLHWLERAVPAHWVLPMRQFTIAAYFVLTFALFRNIFRDDLERVGHPRLLAVAQLLCAAILAAAVLLSFSRFLPFMWGCVAGGVAILVFLLARILRATRSKVAMWYSASLAVVLFAGFYEVAAAALGVKNLIGAINSVTAALTSSLMVALAIAEQMREERAARRAAQAELHDTYEAIPIGLFTLEADGSFARVNPALVAMLGEDPTQTSHRRWSDFFEPGAWERIREAVDRGATIEMELHSLEVTPGESKWILVKVAPGKNAIEGSLQDVTERHLATERLHFLAENDPLTGALNRRGIEKVYAAAAADAGAGVPLALAYLDLDRFKLINDLFGHVSGDEVLRQICDRMRALLGAGHVLGRIGGDEFVLIFRGMAFTAVEKLCRTIVDAIGTSPYRMGDKAFQVKGSIGVLEVAPETSAKDAISMADRACREAKRGQGGVVAYARNANAFRYLAQELRLIERLGAGLAPEGLFLVMQPVMSLQAPQDSLNFEVLVRLREADGSVLPAGRIIPAAENNGRIAVLDRWVLANTLEWLDRNHERLHKTRFACMNLSGSSLNDEKFVEDAFSIIARHRRAASRLCVEITESVALHDLDNTRRFIDRVRGFGAKIALDDFGAGYTSFNYLKDLPADTIKIDGSFVVGVCSHPANLAIVEAIVELTHNLGMKSVAEWVEDRATLEVLVQCGVDYVQGFAIARPQMPEAILAADSGAAFIESEDIARYVRTALGPARALELPDPPADPSRFGLH